MKNDTPNLPHEIITSIMVRLPVKSLIRFQCVCKDWKNLFRTTSFIAAHLRHHSTQQNPLLIVDSDISKGNPWYLLLLNCEMQVLEFRNPHVIDSLMSGCVYYSNGLVCVHLFSKSQHAFYLWNPAIRKVKKVPESLNHYECEYCSIGFGFSPSVNDYKIVKFFMSEHLILQVEVYALRTGLWKQVEHKNLEGVHVSSSNHFTCNGAIFWFGRKEDVEEDSKNYLNLIVSFDIAREVFTLIPFPSITSAHCYYDVLASYEEKLAMFSPSMDNSESYTIDLWVLEECVDPSRERWSWAKIYTSKPIPDSVIINPETIWRDEIVCRMEESEREEEEENNEEKLILFNLTTDEISSLDISKCSNGPQVLDYVESLVLLDNIHI